MTKVTIGVLRVVIALALAGSLLVQTVLMPLLWADLRDAPDGFRVALVAVVVLGIVTMQVVAVCVWRMLTLAQRGAAFSPAAFRYVDVVIAAILCGSALTFLLAVLLAPGGIAPGVVGLVCGAALVIAGVALIVVVLRALLAQAIDRDAEARVLRAELDEVV
jgi:hypothetical protein